MSETPPSFTLKTPPYVSDGGLVHFSFDRASKTYNYYEEQPSMKNEGYPIRKAGIVVFLNIVDNPQATQFLEALERESLEKRDPNIRTNFRIVHKIAESAGNAPGAKEIFGDAIGEIYDYRHIKTLRDKVYIQAYDPTTQELNGPCFEVSLHPRVGDSAIACTLERGSVNHVIFDFRHVETVGDVTQGRARSRIKYLFDSYKK